MKELKEFTVERLSEIAMDAYEADLSNDEMQALAKIALAAKRAKPVAFTSDYGLAALKSGDAGKVSPSRSDKNYHELYTTPPLNHNEQHMVVPDGWKLVPIEPTQDMVDAHIDGMHLAGFSRAYRAMLSAAPKPESE